MKVRNNIIKIIFVSIFIMLICNIDSYASASMNVSASKNTLNVGETASISITANNCAGMFSVTSSNSAVASVSAGSSFVEGGAMETPITITAKSAGTATITVTATDVTEVELDASGNPVGFNGSRSITITVAEVQGNNSNDNGNNGNNPTPTPPPPTTPPAQETPEENLPSFKNVNETVYVKSTQSSVNVRQGYTTDTKLLGSLKSGDSVTRIGIGDNGWSKVTYNGQTAYIISSALTTEEPEEEEEEEETSTNKALKELIVEGYELTPEFNPETTRYSITLEDDEVDKLDITATAEDEKAKVTITGNENLDIENNIIRITVTAEDGTTRIYSISVLKENQTSVIEMVKLSKLQVANATLNPAFDPDVTSYVVEVEDPSTITAKDIVATAEDEDVEVTIAEENDLSENGEKKITIMLEDKEKDITTTYEIFVKKPVNNNLEGMIQENSDKTIYYILGTIIAVLAILIIIIIIVLRKTSNKDDDYEDEEDDDELSDNYDYSLKNAIDEANEDENEDGNDDEYDDMVRGSMTRSQLLNTDYNVFKDNSNDVGINGNEDDEDNNMDLKNKKKGKHF